MTVRAEIIAILDPFLDARVYTDEVPEDTPMPYAALLDDISFVPTLKGDARAMAWRRLIQVDLWETAADESEDLHEDILGALDGAQVTGGTHLSVQSSIRAYEPDPKYVHRALTIEVVSRRSA